MEGFDEKAFAAALEAYSQEVLRNSLGGVIARLSALESKVNGINTKPIEGELMRVAGQLKEESQRRWDNDQGLAQLCRDIKAVTQGLRTRVDRLERALKAMKPMSRKKPRR